MLRINYLAVLVSAAVYWLLGGLWYALFSRPFVGLMRWTPDDLARVEGEGVAWQLGVAFGASLLTAYVLAHFVRYAGARNLADGLKTGFWAFVGFSLTTTLATVLFEGRPFGLYLINGGYNLVGFLLMGGLLAAWRGAGAVEPAYQA